MKDNIHRKNNIDKDLGYHYGLGNGRYAEILHESFVHGGVHSCRTSSLPLAEFWQPDNLERITAILEPHLPGFNATRALKTFEYATDAIRGGMRIGRPSMTDLMLLDGDWQIAIEAKYTEYSRMPSETVGEWLRKGDDFLNRRRVGQTWLGYIQEANCTSFVGRQRFDDSCADVCYQFLHRTASACRKTNDASGRKCALVYQLFFDANDPVSREDRLVFERDLAKWAQALRLRNMKFLVMNVPVLNAAEVVSRYSGMKSEIFEEMATHTIYKFDFDNIEVKEMLPPMPRRLSFDDIASALARHERVALIIRHGDRPPLDKNDTTFGCDLPLTDAGKRSAAYFGTLLAKACGSSSVGFYSSGNRRCRQTAMLMRRQIPSRTPSVAICDFLGDASPYFGNVADRLALADEGNYLDSLNEYFRTGVQRGFNPLAEATDSLEQHVLSQLSSGFSDERVSVFVTHDINVACFLAGRGVSTQFDRAAWPYFLDAAVIFIDDAGRTSYGFLPSPDRYPSLYLE